MSTAVDISMARLSLLHEHFGEPARSFANENLHLDSVFEVGFPAHLWALLAMAALLSLKYPFSASKSP